MPNHGNRQLQVDEVVLLRSMYPEEFHWIQEIKLDEVLLKVRDSLPQQ